jgi:hypothetical protein
MTRKRDNNAGNKPPLEKDKFKRLLAEFEWESQ